LEEEEFHRKLVEENRRRYIRSLKEKHDKEKRLKEKQNMKKEKLKRLQEEWECEILPEWYRKKKDYSNIKNYFYEGIPTNLRGKVWLLCIGNHFSITPEYYEIEVKKAIQILLQIQIEKDGEYKSISLSSVDAQNSQQNKQGEISPIDKTPQLVKYNIKVIDKERSIKYIELDIERTFPYLGIFKANSPLSEDLREILRAFVASRPDIGYVRYINILFINLI
jgi:hypothetical protein